MVQYRFYGFCGLDTLVFLLSVIVDEADVQDRDGAGISLYEVLDRFLLLRHFFVDGGHRGETPENSVEGRGKRTIEIVKRLAEAYGFVVFAEGWVVERISIASSSGWT